MSDTSLSPGAAIDFRRGRTNAASWVYQQPVLDGAGAPVLGLDGKPTYEPVDLTGAVVTFVMAPSLAEPAVVNVSSDTDPDQIEVTDAAGGEIALTLPPAATALLDVPDGGRAQFPIYREFSFELVVLFADDRLVTIRAGLIRLHDAIGLSESG